MVACLVEELYVWWPSTKCDIISSNVHRVCTHIPTNGFHSPTPPTHARIHNQFRRNPKNVFCWLRWSEISGNYSMRAEHTDYTIINRFTGDEQRTRRITLFFPRTPWSHCCFYPTFLRQVRFHSQHIIFFSISVPPMRCDALLDDNDDDDDDVDSGHPYPLMHNVESINIRKIQLAIRNERMKTKSYISDCTAHTYSVGCWRSASQRNQKTIHFVFCAISGNLHSFSFGFGTTTRPLCPMKVL